MATELTVSEIFGPTIQGEGPSVGRRAMFVRLGLCNLNCSWCDAAYTWDWSRFDRAAELTRMPIADVVTQVMAADPALVVITGGEPFVQFRGLCTLVDLLRGVSVEIETNGTLPVGGLASIHPDLRFNVSPKLVHSGIDPLKAIKLDRLAELAGTGKARFKFVCQDLDDLDEVQTLVDAVEIPAVDVWVMAEGVDSDRVHDREARLVRAVLERGWNLTPRFHIDLWGADRGH